MIVLLPDTDHLKQLQAKLLDVPGVWSVERVDEGWMRGDLEIA